MHETFSTSDHSYVTFKFNLPINFLRKKFTYRDFENVDYELLRVHLAIIDRDIYFDGYNDDWNMLWSIFHSIIDELMREYVPVKEFSGRKVACLTPTLKKNMYRNKNRNYRKRKNNPTTRS